MRRVILESPYAGSMDEEFRNIEYAEAALLDSLKRGEAPVASHLLYTRVLDDRDDGERINGIEAGLAWGEVADATVVYVDRGISNGMMLGIRRAKEQGRPVEYRALGAPWSHDK